MNRTLLSLYVNLQGLMNGEEGQDLVEYSLLVALIALVCVSSISNLATAIGSTFNSISSTLGS